MRLSEESLRGRTVIASDGLAVGEIAQLLIDGETWRVDALRVKLRKDVADRLGADRRMFQARVVEVPTEHVQSAGDAVVLSVATDDLRGFLPRESEAVRAP